jgi:septal ring factor EnvC (AmiA/AmiB activator)
MLHEKLVHMKPVMTSLAKWLLISASLLLINQMAYANDNKIEQTKQTLDSVKQKLNKLTEQLANTKEARDDAADALKKSEKAISESKRKLFELAQKQNQHAQTLKQLSAKKTQLQQTIQQQRQQLAQQFYQEYTKRTPNGLQLLLQPEDPNEIARELQYYGYIAKARKLLIDDFQGNLKQIDALNQQVQQTLQEVTVLKNEQQLANKKLESEKLAKAKVVNSLSTQIAEQRKEISRLKRNEQSLLALFEKLNRPAPVKKSSAERKTESADNSLGRTPITQNAPQNAPIAQNDSLPSAGGDAGSFASLKGKLSLPVIGEVMNRFGSSREDTGLTWKGLFIRAAEGSEVKAIATGKVVFADWMRGFGNLMIVDHGQGFMSLYGNNQALLRKAGETVKTGDSIATVGNTGGNPSSGLYYELRQFSRPFDPLSWSHLR